ncbi:MAG: hypothetical protein ACRD5W_04600 [Candidatus Acidiferrales bacterium]
MNRAFIFVLVPAALVATVHSAMRWGPNVALPLGVALAAIIVFAYVWMGRMRSATAKSNRKG